MEEKQNRVRNEDEYRYEGLLRKCLGLLDENSGFKIPGFKCVSLSLVQSLELNLNKHWFT